MGSFGGFGPPQGTVATSVDAVAFPLRAPDGSASAPSYAFSGEAGTGFYRVAANTMAYTTGTAARVLFDNNIRIRSDAYFAWSSDTAFTGVDLLLYREAAATLQMGADVNGAAVAQTLKAHDGITGTDIAGANLTLAGGRGTGSGAPGDLILSVATELATGTTAQTLAAILTLSGGNNASVRNHLLYTAPTGDLAMTASTEAIGAVFGGTSTYTREYATGALSLHRENLIQGPTIAFVGASTLTNVSTLDVLMPIAGANATFTKSDALRVQAGNGTGRAGLGGTLYVDPASHTTTGTSQETLATYTLPANSLNQNGRVLRVRAWGVTAANGNNKLAELYLGSQLISQTGTVTSNAQTWVLDATVTRVGANSQYVLGEYVLTGTTARTTVVVGAATVTDTSDQAVTMKGTTSGAAGDLTCKGFIVEFLN